MVCLEITEDLLIEKEKKAQSAAEEFKSALLDAPLEDAVHFWNSKKESKILSELEKQNQKKYVLDMIKKDLLPLVDVSKVRLKVREFNILKEEILERFKKNDSLSVKEKRYRFSALISLSQFLHDATDGAVDKFSYPNFLTVSWKEKNPTFPLSVSDYRIFLKEVEKISKRDFLVVETMFHTARNLLRVLMLSSENIDLIRNEIIFRESHFEHAAIQVDREHIMALGDYIKETADLRKKTNTLFLTNQGRPIFRTHFQQVCEKASEKASLGFAVTTKMIQWSLVADYLKNGTAKDQIMKKFNLRRIPEHLEE